MAEPTGLQALDECSERFHQQWTAGEWEGPGQMNWLTGRYPCGQEAVGRRNCPCASDGSGHRGLPPWSQVMAAPDLPFGRFVR